jgi:Domain of unknown function (DUF222)
MFDVGVAPYLVEPEAWGELPPGPGLAALLSTMRLSEVDDWSLVEVVRGWERVVSWAAAQQLAAVAELAGRRPAEQSGGGPNGSISEFAIDEVAAALRLSRPAAGARLHLAVDLAGRLPATAAALHAGEIDVPKARAVVEASTPLDPPAARAVERRVLPRAGRQTLGQLRASLARATLTLDPAGAQARHERAMTGRRVAVTPQPDGMAELWALLPADGAATIRRALDTAARQCPGDDPRSMDARRADALVDLVTGGSAGRHPDPGGSRSGARVSVTVPATTLLGLAEEPGELTGHGPIPASMARRIAADGTWRRILTDPASGTVLDVGRTTYRPPAGLADHVRVRDGTCRFPGCRQPAGRCDLDHTTPFPEGPTSSGNLVALCRHHHRLKHNSRWRVEQHDDGTLSWIAPTGHRYTTAPQHAATDP